MADWLAERMDQAVLDDQAKLMEARDPKDRAQYGHPTAGEGLSPDEIVALCPEAAEDEKALRRQIAKDESILLWFD